MSRDPKSALKSLDKAIALAKDNQRKDGPLSGITIHDVLKEIKDGGIDN